ncbi:MAG: excinuclease ABC subunit UvrC [Candidatus Andersenbacteria bacterium]|nr:excinuclease ABC subunit UvrC [Candidatus Andersenbacteria bacterium]
MVKHIVTIETITVDSETEALILEANLIRKHQPPYNVVLRDDKYYLFIKITNEEYQRVFPVRKIKSDNARYFGPYSSARSVRQTLKLLRRVFPHQGEKESPREVVFPHPLFTQSDIGQAHKLPLADYNANIQNIIHFLKGQRQEIVNVLQRGMKQASAAGQYERAAIFRDQLMAIERLEGDQKVYLPRKETFDVVSIARRAGKSAANVFQVREGKLLGKQTFLLQHRSAASPEDTLRQFLLQYYRVAQDIPKLIFIPLSLVDQDTIATFINQKEPISFAVPVRGKKKQLLELGVRNADMLLDEQDAVFESQTKARLALDELLTAIGVPTPPAPASIRVEIYDISNIQGTLATASMAVFEDGLPSPSKYRKFRMRVEGKPNDFAMLQETLGRRFGNHQKDWPMPHLVIIDGGKGQLSSAVKILRALSIAVPVISIAKQEEEIFVPGNSASIRLPHTSPALHLIQRMRDEAHRFTITYHRLLRSKEQRRSLLDEIPGIGPSTKKKLLARFGSLKGIRAASDEELAEVIGKARLGKIRDYL